MRISDWSSDVCSSDLLPTTHGTAFDGLYQADAFAAFAKLLIYIAAAISIVIAPRFFAVGGIPRAEYPLLIIFASVGKIGRASCRERGCQYGVDLGGCRIIKKKNNKECGMNKEK